MSFFNSFDCRDKNGSPIFLGAYVEYDLVKSVAIGRTVEERLEGKTGHVREVRFSIDGTIVLKLSNNRTVQSKDVIVKALTEPERELARIITKCGGSYSYDELKMLAAEISRTVTIQNAIEAADDTVTGEPIAAFEIKDGIPRPVEVTA